MYNALKRYYRGVLIVLMIMSLSESTHLTTILRQDEPSITLEAYNKRIANTNKAVLVYFSAGWCSVCPKFKPVIAEIEKEYSGKMELIRIDTERDTEVAKELGISELPLLV